MNILLHTIAIEPARWLPQRVSRSLLNLIPILAKTPFQQLEIFEPHLTLATDETSVRDCLREHELSPVVLSSYLNLSPTSTDAAAFSRESEGLVERARGFGFRKIRIFPGPGVSPCDTGAVAIVAQRIRELASRLPEIELLLETHDGSIADDPQAIVDLLDMVDTPNVGLLWQPTIFKPEPALAQLAIQKPFIRHCHLQNRDPKLDFTTLRNGLVPWHQIISALNVDVSIEFVPTGICPPEQFDLDQTLKEAAREADYVRVCLESTSGISA